MNIYIHSYDNRVITLGDWSTYQAADSVWVGELHTAMQFEFRTKTGKSLCAWAEGQSSLMLFSILYLKHIKTYLIFPHFFFF